MATLVSLADFKHQLGLAGFTTDDRLLTMHLEAATQNVLNYIARPDDTDWTAEIASWGSDPGSPLQVPVPVHIRQAILMWGTELYRFRGDEPDAIQRDNPGDPSPSVKACLARGGRRPVFA